MTQYLFTRGRRYVSPFSLVDALAALLQESQRIVDGLVGLTNDTRWSDASEHIGRARAALLEPTDEVKTLRKRAAEQRQVEATLENLDRNPDLVEDLKNRPRKTMAWVRDPQRAIAARVVRRRRQG